MFVRRDLGRIARVTLSPRSSPVDPRSPCHLGCYASTGGPGRRSVRHHRRESRSRRDTACQTTVRLRIAVPPSVRSNPPIISAPSRPQREPPNRAKGTPMDNRQDDAWLAFAALVLFIAGIMRIFDAIWAFRYHGAVPENLQDAIFGHSLKTYGWIDIVVAAILLISAALVLSRSQ